MSVQVMIVEDEQELLARFAEAVRADAGLCLIGAVASGAAAHELLETAQPDVVLVDLGLPDMSGIEVIRSIVRRLPEADILVVTMFGDEQHVLASIEAGATGYLLKDTAMQGIIDSIHQIRNGGSPISPTIARRILSRMRFAKAAAQPASTDPGAAPADVTSESPLSTRETDILRLISKGLSFGEVGAQLGISAHTVVTHVKKIYRKLAVHSRGEAVYEANQLGLL